MSYDRLGCQLVAIFKGDSISDSSHNRKGTLHYKCKKIKKEFIWAVNKVITEEQNKEQKEQLRLIA